MPAWRPRQLATNQSHRSDVIIGIMMEILALGSQEFGLKLNSRQLLQFETYFRELVAWNRKFNLTAVTAYEDVQVRHFLDSLTVALALPQSFASGLKVIDVGAGAGFPGLPLKILIPEISLTLLESTHKKAAFLTHLVNTLELDETVILPQRAEEAAHAPAHREHYDVVVSRAVAALPPLLELTLPFCSVGGMLIAQKKGDFKAELGSSASALKILCGEIAEVKEVSLPGLSDKRSLVVVKKVAPTPTPYPRRPGMPVKRPLL